MKSNSDSISSVARYTTRLVRASLEGPISPALKSPILRPSTERGARVTVEESRRTVKITPAGASAGFGIPIHDPAAFPFMWIKGIRDIFSGLVVLPFLLKADRRTTATLFAISIVVPFGDGLVILRHLGLAPPIYIHWGTALYMMIVAAFLLRKPNTMEGVS